MIRPAVPSAPLKIRAGKVLCLPRWIEQMKLVSRLVVGRAFLFLGLDGHGEGGDDVGVNLDFHL